MAQVTSATTSAQAAESQATTLRSALSALLEVRASPLLPDAWDSLLLASGLSSRYPTVSHGIRFGFSLGFIPVSSTFSPPNSSSLSLFNEHFQSLVENEFARGRYLGPFSRSELETLIGPFQSSPLSLVPKPHNPNKLRLVQNMSYPFAPRGSLRSVNFSVDSAAFPCTWGSFAVFSLLISMLPPGSQLACRDISEAFRTIPLCHSQFPSTVVRLSNSEDILALDRAAMFGARACPGVYGLVADAGADLMRWRGIGPLIKWVDDTAFARVQRSQLDEYNTVRRAVKHRISAAMSKGGRTWFNGQLLADDSLEEFVEDFAFDIQDLSMASPRSDVDAQFSYCFADIDSFSKDVGYIWNLEKDSAFGSSVTYIGFEWDLNTQTVRIPDTKRSKYTAAIKLWLDHRTHTLLEAQSLHGKLMHACSIVPMGRAYLTRLAAFMGGMSNNPHAAHTPHHRVPADLQWWLTTLADARTCTRSIPRAVSVGDPGAFSDASSGVGIGVIFRGRWRAWNLRPGWMSDGRDIQWAEAVGFELLCHYAATSDSHVKVYGDNKAVVEGWAKHCSRNSAVNDVFRRIHMFLQHTSCTVHARFDSHSFLCHPCEPNMSFPATSQAAATLLTVRLEESTPPTRSFSHRSFSPLSFPTSSATTAETRSSVVHSRAFLSPTPNENTAAASTRTQPTTSNQLTTADSRPRRTAPSAWPSRFAPYSTRPRPYAADLAPLPSALRPHCTARERLLRWSPLPSPSNLSLPPAQQSLVFEVLSRSLAAGTLETYGSGLLLFHVMCDAQGIAEHDRAPASRNLISVFISELAGSYSESAVRNAVSGVRAWHTLHRHAWLADDREVDSLVRAAAKLAPPKRAPRPAFSLADLQNIIAHLNPNIALDTAVRAAVLVCFWGTARLGEMLPRTLTGATGFDSERCVTLRNLSHRQDMAGNTVSVLHIPQTKVAPVTGEDIYWGPRSDGLDATTALQQHLAINAPSASQHLFAYVDKNKKLKPLTKSIFLSRLKAAAAAANAPLVPGHSIRISSTTHYLMSGMGFDAVRVKGRWASDSFILYLRRHAEIMAQYLQEDAAVHAEILRRTAVLPPAARR